MNLNVELKFIISHAEYNQHGGPSVQSAQNQNVGDYNDPYHYYSPQRVNIDTDKGKVIKVSCGANFTLAITEHFEVISW